MSVTWVHVCVHGVGRPRGTMPPAMSSCPLTITSRRLPGRAWWSGVCLPPGLDELDAREGFRQACRFQQVLQSSRNVRLVYRQNAVVAACRRMRRTMLGRESCDGCSGESPVITDYKLNVKVDRDALLVHGDRFWPCETWLGAESARTARSHSVPRARARHLHAVPNPWSDQLRALADLVACHAPEQERLATRRRVELDDHFRDRNVSSFVAKSGRVARSDHAATVNANDCDASAG